MRNSHSGPRSPMSRHKELRRDTAAPPPRLCSRRTGGERPLPSQGLRPAAPPREFTAIPVASSRGKTLQLPPRARLNPPGHKRHSRGYLPSPFVPDPSAPRSSDHPQRGTPALLPLPRWKTRLEKAPGRAGSFGRDKTRAQPSPGRDRNAIPNKAVPKAPGGDNGDKHPKSPGGAGLCPPAAPAPRFQPRNPRIYTRNEWKCGFTPRTSAHRASPLFSHAPNAS